MKCRICGNKNLAIFLSLGRTPLANSFLSKEDLDKEEKTFPLEVCFCLICKLVQLTYVVNPELMFKRYIYVSSTSNTFKRHFTSMADDIYNRFSLTEKSFVVDIGSNDGLLLKGFRKYGVQTIGVEPAGNIAAVAEKDGIETINDFFNENVAKQIIDKNGYADVVTANNVFAHVNNIHEFTKNVKSLLKNDGIFIIEAQYLVDTIEKMTFDNIYHEHLSYFTLTSLINFFKKHNMEIFDAKRVDSHGGSLRVFIKKAGGKYDIQKEVGNILKYEKEIGVDNLETYKKFAVKVDDVRENIVAYIKKLKKDGKSIAGYGAPAKSTTLLNFCNLGAGSIDYIVDDSPLKPGLYAPGTHIQVVSSAMLDKKKPDCILILAWNFADEILEKNKKYRNRGVKFIIPLPKLAIA